MEIRCEHKEEREKWRPDAARPMLSSVPLDAMVAAGVVLFQFMTLWLGPGPMWRPENRWALGAAESFSVNRDEQNRQLQRLGGRSVKGTGATGVEAVLAAACHSGLQEFPGQELSQK